MLHTHVGRNRFARVARLSGWAGLAALACSDDARVLEGEISPLNPSNPAGAPGDEAPLYMTAALVSTGDSSETRLVLTDTFDENTVIDLGTGVSVLGPVVPVVHDGAVFLTEGDAPVVRRYDVGPDRQLVRTAELSFAGVGVTEVPSWNVYIVSDTKGYVYDARGSRLVAWNPSTMELSGTIIDLSLAAREGWSLQLMLEFFGPRQRGSELLLGVSWVDQDFNYRHASGLLALDVETDTVLGFSEDERCGETYGSIEAPNGDLYFFPSADSSAQHFYGEGLGPTCVLRVPSGSREFDPAEPLNLSALGSGGAASGAVPDGSTGFYFSTVDDTLWQGRENNGEAYWRIWHYDFATQASREVTGLPAWAGTTYYVNVGGTHFLPYWSTGDAGDRTTVYQLDRVSNPTPLFSFEANWYGFNRLR